MLWFAFDNVAHNARKTRRRVTDMLVLSKHGGQRSDSIYTAHEPNCNSTATVPSPQHAAPSTHRFTCFWWLNHSAAFI